jgi:hypothetical protein
LLLTYFSGLHADYPFKELDMEILIIALIVFVGLFSAFLGDLLLAIFFKKLDKSIASFILKFKNIKPLVLIKQLITHKL